MRRLSEFHESPSEPSASNGIQTDAVGIREVLAQRQLVSPLNAENYNEVFYGRGGFVPNSTEYWDELKNAEGPMPRITREILNQVQPKRVLSIGAGDGKFDGDVLSHLPLETYVGIEPNSHHAEKLRGNIASHPWKEKRVIEGIFHENLTPNDLHGGEFDAALYTHCAYFFQNPGQTIAKARSLMSPRGVQIILHQTGGAGVCPFYKYFSARLGLWWDPNVSRQDHAMSTESISKELSSLSVPHALGQGDCGIWVDHLLSNAPSDQETHWKIPSFFMNTDIREFPPQILKEMREYIADHSRSVDNRRMFDHPQGFVVVPGEKADWKHPEIPLVSQ